MKRTILIVIGSIGTLIISIIGIMFWSSYHSPVNTAHRQLNDKNPDVRAAAILNLSEIGDKASIPRIRQLFHDKDANVSRCAASFLSDLGDQSSIPEMRELLQSKDTFLRAIAINTLRKLGDRESIIEIKKCLNDENAFVRYRAIHFLAEIAGLESIPDIKKLLYDKDIHISDAAGQVLLKLGVPAEEIQTDKDKTEAKNFKAIADFYRKKFPNTSFQNSKVGAGFTDGGPKEKTKYHIFVPNEIEQLYLHPYSDGFLREQLTGADPLEKTIADNLLQLQKGVLYTRSGATESYDGAHEIECTDYVTHYKYYLLDHPRKELIPVIKELLKDKDKWVRNRAEWALKDLGVPGNEIQKAKEQK